MIFIANINVFFFWLLVLFMCLVFSSYLSLILLLLFLFYKLKKNLSFILDDLWEKKTGYIIINL